MYFDEYLKIMKNQISNPPLAITSAGTQKTSGKKRVLLYTKEKLNLYNYVLHLGGKSITERHLLPNKIVEKNKHICIYINESDNDKCYIKGEKILTFNIKAKLDSDEIEYISLYQLEKIDKKEFDL